MRKYDDSAYLRRLVEDRTKLASVRTSASLMTSPLLDKRASAMPEIADDVNTSHSATSPADPFHPRRRSSAVAFP